MLQQARLVEAIATARATAEAEALKAAALKKDLAETEAEIADRRAEIAAQLASMAPVVEAAQAGAFPANKSAQLLYDFAN